MNAVDQILNRTLLLDLEVKGEKIIKVGAVLGEEVLYLKGKFDAAEVKRGLNKLAKGADFVLGHNILQHDLPLLKKAYPRLKLHRLPVIDTLYLSPIAFPKNPYHHLVKDYRLVSTGLNDPVLDARESETLFKDEAAVFEKLKAADADLLRFYGWAFASTMRPLFEKLGAAPFSEKKAKAFFAEEAALYGCGNAAVVLADAAPEAMAYALAWLRVAGSNSILPPWTRHQFPDVIELTRALREKNCGDPACAYCAETHDPRKQLERFFGFPDFRAKPALPNGDSLQRAIVQCGMNNDPLLAILPTGGGKSLCYQLPALVRSHRRGTLSIVISPLQALMKDQVDNLNEITGSGFSAALYGMLTPPERGQVLERTRLGDVSILYVSPEQLRNVSFRETIRQREIGCWIFDEAHCLSRWGHSFRPDYLYAARFIREMAQKQNTDVPPVACFTATAKQDVVDEIREHFQKELSQELRLFDGGAERTNLGYEVRMVNAAEKEQIVQALLRDWLPNPDSGSAVIYRATRDATQQTAERLQREGFSAEAFHAGLKPPEKRRIQDAFMSGEIQHICATNAFGMGIDKDNVRLVVHADIPGSLENYLQEAGRAGRDREQAHCVLLYDEQDIETQFSMSAFSRLTRHDIAQILRGLRRAKRDEQDKIVITAGEILRDDQVDTGFDMDDKMYATKINTAVSMLERGDFVRRDENRTRVIHARPVPATRQEAVEQINALELSESMKYSWHCIMASLYDRNPNDALSADELAEQLPSTSPTNHKLQHDTLPVLKILNDMANAGLIKKDTALSAYLKVRCANAADKRLTAVVRLEKSMIAILRESDPDAEGWMALSLRRLNQRLLDEGHACAPESLRMLLKSLEFDGKGLAGKRGSLELKYRDKDRYAVKLQRDWAALTETAEKRQAVAGVILEAIAGKVPKGSSGEILVEFSESELTKALRADLFLAPRIKDFTAAIERGLLYLHEQKVIILQQGLAVFRSAMRITILPSAKGRAFTMGDYSSLREHYRERVFQIHVMNRYADLGLADTAKAVELVRAYFTMAKALFVKQFFPGQKDMLERATSAESYQRIVEHLNNGVQTAVVSARITQNMLVLAGPGSGKTRVIAHRCAYLLKVERVRSREILVVCFNRAAALSLRRRIRDLAGKDAIGITVQTYHALAMRLIGASLAERSERQDGPPAFDEMIRAATAMIRGEHDVPGLEPDEMRERLLAGYRHILIDEYQDINQDQYDMVSAIAGRTLDSSNQDARLSILAVGDDDQNIYSFQGANIRFIRQFERDYNATTHYLVENYRSSSNIIAAANQLIDRNTDRMKRDQPIRINKARANESPGTPVRVVQCVNVFEQARFALETIRQHQNESVAVFARTNRELHPILAATHAAGIDAVLAASKRGAIPLHRTRETRALIQFLKELDQKTITAKRIQQEFRAMPFHKPNNPWCRATDELLDEWTELTLNDARTPYDAIDFLYEASHEARREQSISTNVLLSSIHAAKGLEFDHVIILGDWKPVPDEEERRLYYVGMTRARVSLTLCELDGHPNPYTQNLLGPYVRHSRAESSTEGPPDEVLQIRFSTLTPTDVWIGYSAASREIQRNIAAVEHGNRVHLDLENQRIFIRDLDGQKIGAFSTAASQRWSARLGLIEEARIHSIINWKKEFSECVDENAADEWEFPLLEIEWTEPSAQ